MIKLGLMHAMLIDMAAREEQHRKPRVTDAFIQSVAPFDTGMFMLRLMDHIGMLDEEQRTWLCTAEQAEREGRDSLL
jgi:hypothetical protein